MAAVDDTVRIRCLGLQAYTPLLVAMQAFTRSRHADTLDELWCLQHLPVFTQGQAGKPEHVLQAGEIPVVQSDRGGQVTYHGPGQLVVYLLVDIARRRLGPRQQVTLIENAVIRTLAVYGVMARARPEAPGVYVGEAKIAQLGLRIRQGRSYHGLSLNVDMNLAPFSRINPCGHAGLAVTQLVDCGVGEASLAAVQAVLLDELCQALGYTARLVTDREWTCHDR